MNLLNLISPNQIFAILSKGIEGGKVIFLNVLIARYMGAEDLGIYAFILGVSSLIAVLAEFRIQNVLVKELVISEESNKGRLLGSALTVNGIFAILGSCILLIYCLFFEVNEVIISGLIIYCAVFFIKIPRAFRALFISLEKNKFIMIAEVLSSFVMIVLSVAVIIYQPNVINLIVVKLLDILFISIVFVVVYVFNFSQIKISINKDVIKELITKSYPLVISAAAMILFQKIDLIMIKYYLGNVPAGFYNAATTYMMIFSLLPMVLSESLAPRYFRRKSRGNKEDFISLIVFVGIVMSILMFISSKYMIPVLYGDLFEKSILSTQILSLTPIAIALGCSAGQVIVFHNVQRKAFLKSIIACMVNIILNIILIPLLGIEGAAIATLVGLFIANFISHKFIDDFKSIYTMQINAVLFRNWRGNV